MSSMAQLWQKKGEEPTANTQEGTTVGNPIRKIKMGALDPILLLFATLLSQIAVAIAVVTLWVSKNIEELSESENTADAIAIATQQMLSGPVILITSISMYIVWIAFLFFSSRKRGFGSFKKDYWLKFRKKDLLIGLIFAASLRVIEFGVVNILSAAGVDMSSANNSSLLTDLNGIWLFINAFIIASFVGPILEELVFRGLIMQSLLRLLRDTRASRNDYDITTANALGVWLSIRTEQILAVVFKARNWIALFLTSLIFGFMHFQGTDNFGQWFVVIWTGTLGFVLGLITIKTKRLGGAIIGHVLFNLSGVALSVFI